MYDPHVLTVLLKHRLRGIRSLAEQQLPIELSPKNGNKKRAKSFGNLLCFKFNILGNSGKIHRKL
jgi:hypothetical protein